METYAKFRPTGFDCAGLGLEERQDWFVAPISRNRDSGLLDTSNWETFTKEIEAVAGDEDESNGWEIHRFGHWGPGWFELVLIKPDTPAFKVAEETAKSLENYPVLSDEHYSEIEYEATCENIGYELRRIETREKLPDSIVESLFSWFWDNNQGAVENSDDQGGCPTEEELSEALDSLGYTIVLEQ